ncbi:MAG: PTS sugar transporter subunit IIA [Treponema sp.]|nr:PTS sugar transporter subunit IIA [Treponema sp.]MBQ2601733.1 PTS sugar transporter subunit IIA [Treponema sp.]
MFNGSGDRFDVLCNLILSGGVVADVEGSTADEIFGFLSESIEMPEGVTRESFRMELSEREKILSTAVGHGFAIPHPRKSILKNESEQKIIVCYPKTPIEMSSPDGSRVSVMFIMLTKVTQIHQDALSDLAKLVHCVEFRHFLDSKPSVENLVLKIKELHALGKLD